MAEVRSIKVMDDGVLINLELNMEEYSVLGQKTKDILLLPGGHDTLSHRLTTGKLGNSNRIMLPKKMLEAVNVSEPDKKVPSNIFRINGEAYLLIKVKSSDEGIPKFSD